jgi:hypothetical protein
VLYDDDKSSDEDEQQQTIKFNPMRTAGGPPTEQYLPKTSATSPDERAITPLKDKMVYDKVFSSLDFKDGEFFICTNLSTLFFGL